MRGSHLAGVTTACLVALLATTLTAQSAAPPQSKPLSRLERLETWIAAVERHEPGLIDDPATEVGAWDRATLRQLWLDVASVATLVRNPRANTFLVRSDEPRGGAIQVTYSRDELRRLRNLAGTIGDENRVLKRGALLHADIAMLAPTVHGPVDALPAPGGAPVMLFMTDGRQAGLGSAVHQWEMGRRLLNLVRPDSPLGTTPDPSRDDTVRLWYLATGMFMQNVEQLDPPHFRQAARMFSDDAEMLFLGGCFHEMLSEQRVQSAIRSATVVMGQIFDVGSEGNELRQAETLFRRALDIKPEAAETRIHLGRALGRLGRHADAAIELRRAISASKDPLLLYYGALFLGGEAEALQNRNEARRSYEQAAALYPRAQSPRLALSRLETLDGNRTAALAAIQGVMARSDRVDDHDDPWWTYHVAQARGADALVDELRQVFRTGPLR